MQGSPPRLRPLDGRGGRGGERGGVTMKRKIEVYDRLGLDPDAIEALLRRSVDLMLGRKKSVDDVENATLVKFAETQVEKDAGDSGRVRIAITSDAEDRMGDVVSVDGWSFKNYEK